MPTRFDNDLTTEAVRVEIGRRIAAQRLDANLTQQSVAEEAGISRRTLQRLESGHAGVTLETLVRTLRVLKMVEGFEQLIPKVGISPMQLLKLQGNQRRRGRESASQRKAPSGPWKWGDE